MKLYTILLHQEDTFVPRFAEVLDLGPDDTCEITITDTTVYGIYDTKQQAEAVKQQLDDYYAAQHKPIGSQTHTEIIEKTLNNPWSESK